MRVTPVDALLTSRGSTHGDYNETARLAQALKRVVRSARCWEGLKDDQRESIDLITLKVARILSGNPEFAEHWDDIIGYAALIARTLKEPE